MSEAMDVILAGRNIGQAAGWDMHDTLVLSFMGFAASDEAVKAGLCNGDMAVDFDLGRITISDDDGKNLIDIDVIECLSQIERS